MSCTESSPMQFFTMSGPGKAKEMGNCVDNKPCVSYITYRNIHVISTYRKPALKSDLVTWRRLIRHGHSLPLITKKVQHQIKLSGGRLETKGSALFALCRTHCHRILWTPSLWLSVENTNTNKC